MSFALDMRGTIILTAVMLSISYFLSWTLGDSPLYCPILIAAWILVLALGNWRWIKYKLGGGGGGGEYYD